MVKTFYAMHRFELVLSLRLIIAFLCGIVIGHQRQKAKNDDVSILRTHVLLCMGAALVGSTSEWLYTVYPNIDVTRISAQVISGISFVGVGVIVKNGSTINGLTTAASLWAVGAVGIAIGSGAYVLGIMSTLLILSLLLFTRDK